MAPVVVHLNGGCCSPSTFEKLAQTDYDQEIEQINVTYGRRQRCTSKLGPAIGILMCTGFTLVFIGLFASIGNIGGFAEEIKEIGEPCRRRLQTSSDSECCIATPEGSQFLCNIGTTEFFCTGNSARSCTWTCAAPPSPPPDGSTARDTSGCEEEDFKSSFFESTSSGPSNCIILGFVICFGGAPAVILYLL